MAERADFYDVKLPDWYIEFLETKHPWDESQCLMVLRWLYEHNYVVTKQDPEQV